MSQATGEASADAVTFSRRELKFALPGVDPAAIIATLAGSLEPVRFGKRDDSVVQSIYFDNDQLVSCRESMDGVSRRTKLRLRWYDSPMTEVMQLWFELKHRRNVSVSKQRFPIQLERPLSEYRFGELHQIILCAIANECSSAAEWFAQRPSPTVLIAYRRRHFRDPSSGIRITIDRDICGYDQLGLGSPALRLATPLDGLTVIEVKTPVGDEIEAGKLLYPLKPRITRSSKYASCCSRMGWGILSEPHD